MTGQIESDEFWDLFWEDRLPSLQNLGKKEAILAISKLIRQLAQIAGAPLRLLELGCGEGQIIGSLVTGHPGLCPASAAAGVDLQPAAIRACRRAYPMMVFIEGDFTDASLMESLGQFDVVMLVNALHEVFSAGYSPSLGEIDVPDARVKVEQALLLAARRVRTGGSLVLFDGLEPPGDPQQIIRLRFLSRQALDLFRVFAEEYRPFRVAYREVGGRDVVEMTRRDFTRYITKSIFLGKQLWETERFESYQYYTESEFRSVFARCGLEIFELRTLTVDDEKWRQCVQILTPGVGFPEEHILIVAHKKGN
jgi:SAM-dependent methyltransferase